MQQVINWFSKYPMYAELIYLLVFAILSSLILNLIYNHFKPRLKEGGKVWNLALLRAGYQPLLCLIWLLVLFFILNFMCKIGDLNCSPEYIYIACALTSMGLIFWFSTRFIKSMERIMLVSHGASHESRATVRAVAQISRVAIVVISILIIMQILGLPISGLVTFGGVGGIVLGFAARDMLANFFGGLMLFWNRPFTEGDWIRSADRMIEGVVEKIGWRQTRLRTFDKRPLYIPNSIFSTITVENPSRMTNRRIKTIIGLRYDDAKKLPAVLQDIRQMLKDHADIDQAMFTMVRLVGFGDSALNVMLYTFTKTVDWGEFQAVQEDVFLKVLDIIDQHGAECAFPTQTLHVPEVPSDAVKGAIGAS